MSSNAFLAVASVASSRPSIFLPVISSNIWAIPRVWSSHIMPSLKASEAKFSSPVFSISALWRSAWRMPLSSISAKSAASRSASGFSISEYFHSLLSLCSAVMAFFLSGVVGFSAFSNFSRLSRYLSKLRSPTSGNSPLTISSAFLAPQLGSPLYF